MANHAKNNLNDLRSLPRQNHDVTDGTSNTIMVAERYQMGLSGLGAAQFVKGQPVSNQNDRRVLANALAQAFGIRLDVSLALLIPAVQKIRDAATRTQLHLDISQNGLVQFLTAQAVTDQKDRKALAILVPATMRVRQVGKINGL
jgi:hypothetical protein